MISQITGILVQKEPQFVVLETSGIGYEIEVPMSTYFELPKLGNEVKLITFFHVREDNQKLYGFKTFNSEFFYNCHVFLIFTLNRYFIFIIIHENF